jgi:arsenate reductase (glutaredoxin)
MNIQIIGHNKCNDTKKAMRFFKERNVNFHFKDIKEKPLSRGELENITRKISPENLINKDSKVYKSKGYEYMDYDPKEEILENAMILKTPVVRNGADCTKGYKPEVWKEWVKS